MGLFTRSGNKLNWNQLESIEQLHMVFESSTQKPVLLFKHSTRCSISSMALNRFESEWDESTNCSIYYLDLLAFRPVSNEIAVITQVEHQSPQAILIINKDVKYSASHSQISASDIQKILNQI